MNPAQKHQVKAIDITSLPALPQIVFNLLDACEAPDTPLSDIAGLIRQESVLAARVLSLSASPVFAGYHQQRSLTLEQSTLRLGLNTIRTLALSAAIHQFIGQSSIAGQESVLGRLWRTSLLTAELAERLAGLSGYPHKHEAYLAGLISNLGQVALLKLAPKHYATLIEQTHESGKPLPAQEIEIFGIDHAELGAGLLQRAGRTGPLVDAVHFHHAHEDALTNAHHLVRIVAVANHLADANPETDAKQWIDAERLLGILPSLLEEEYKSCIRRAEQTVLAFGRENGTGTPNSFESSPLAKRLGEMHLLSSVRWQLNDTENINELCSAARFACDLLFGLKSVGFALLQSDTSSAKVLAPGDPDPIWSEFTFRLPDHFSLVGKTLASGEVHKYYPWKQNHKEETSLAVVDREILTLFQHEGLLAAPLMAVGEIQGAMLIGLDQEDSICLEAKHRLLMLFIREIGAALAAHRQRTQQQDAALHAQSEEFLMRAQRIAHEAKNPLSIIQNYLSILEKHAASGSQELNRDIKIMREEISRVGAILRTLSDAADESQPSALDLNGLIKDVVRLIHPTLLKPRGIQIELDLDPAIPELELPRNSIKQILVNLLKNAAEALHPGQTITVSSTDGIYSGEQAYVGIEIRDTGPGIPPQILAQLFQPVVSTKGKGHSGLGLAITKQLVDTIGGRITCQSSSSGTRFQLLFPRQLAEA